jgi:LPXTG-motif cell wall-anchored protein
MDLFKSPATGSMTSSLVILMILLFLSFGMGLFLRESSMLKSQPGS